jgi:hypothetical protein
MIWINCRKEARAEIVEFRATLCPFIGHDAVVAMGTIFESRSKMRGSGRS